MKNTESQSDVSLSTIRQMTVNNALLRQENRRAIMKMRQDHEKDVQALREDSAERKLNIDTFLSKAEKHLDRAADLQEEIRQIQRENIQGIKELRELQKETGRQMKETDKKIKELSTRFSSTTGHIIEGLMSSSAIKIYEEAGIKIDSLCKNFKRKNKSLNLEMEMDVVLLNDTQVVVEEVKASCDKKDVEKFFHNMEKFKLLYNEYADKEVFGAIAAVNYENDADKYAHELGLFVVRVASDEIFTLDPFKMEELKRF